MIYKDYLMRICKIHNGEKQYVSVDLCGKSLAETAAAIMSEYDKVAVQCINQNKDLYKYKGTINQHDYLMLEDEYYSQYMNKINYAQFLIGEIEDAYGMREIDFDNQYVENLIMLLVEMTVVIMRSRY